MEPTQEGVVEKKRVVLSGYRGHFRKGASAGRKWGVDNGSGRPGPASAPCLE